MTPKGLTLGNHPPVPLTSAPAFGSAVESKDTVVAVGTPRELSQTISAILGDASEKKVYLFPVVARQNVVAVLYAEPEDHRSTSAPWSYWPVWPPHRLKPTETVVVKSPAVDLVRIAGAPAPAGCPDVDGSDQAGAGAASSGSAVRADQGGGDAAAQSPAGSEWPWANNLYGVLKEEIEAGREAFRREFIDTCPSMVDYFHLELQRTLAKMMPALLVLSILGLCLWAQSPER